MWIGTFSGFLLALFFYAVGIGNDWSANAAILGIILIAVGTVFLFAPLLVLAFSWSPLQVAEQTLTPRISDLYLRDRNLNLVKAILILFPLVTFAFAIDIYFVHFLSINALIPLWFLLLGPTIDAFYYLTKRISGYLDPFYVADLLTKEATRAIQSDNELELYKWIDALAEEGVWAVSRSSEALCNHVCSEMQKIARVYLESSKTLPRVEESQTVPELGISDRVSYTLFYLLSHLEKINAKAAAKGLESVCSHVVTTVGKIVISAAKYDMSMTSYPLFCLGKFTIEAQKKGLQDVGTKAICTLVEVAKTILGEIDVTYLEIREPFEKLVTQLDEVTKEMFRHDKTVSVKFLMQPFLDIKALFESEKIRLHPDSEPIVQFINRILAEYAALEAVLRSVPPKPPIEAK